MVDHGMKQAMSKAALGICAMYENFKLALRPDVPAPSAEIMFVISCTVVIWSQVIILGDWLQK